MGADPGALFSAREAGIAVITYAKNEGLEEGASTSAHLLLDTQLCDALYKVSFLYSSLIYRSAPLEICHCEHGTHCVCDAFRPQASTLVVYVYCGTSTRCNLYNLKAGETHVILTPPALLSAGAAEEGRCFPIGDRQGTPSGGILEAPAATDAPCSRKPASCEEGSAAACADLSRETPWEQGGPWGLPTVTLMPPCQVVMESKSSRQNVSFVTSNVQAGYFLPTLKVQYLSYRTGTCCLTHEPNPQFL